MKINFNKLHEDARLPEYFTKGASGVDVFAQIPGMGAHLGASEIKAIPTGISVEVPKGYELQVRSRSGLSLQGIVVVNAPGTIDSDYRGEIYVILKNTTEHSYSLSRHDRIAQLVLAKVERIEWVDKAALSPTTRGTGKFGSTGK